MKTRIAKKHCTAIADLINELQVAEIFVEKYVGSGELERYHRWTYSRCKVMIQLADDYGIELVGLDHARDTVDMHRDMAQYYREQELAKQRQENQELTDLMQGETIPKTYCKVMKNDGVYFVVSRYGQQKIETTDAQIALDYARDYDQAQSGAVDHTNVKQYSFELVKPDGRTFNTAVQSHSFTSAIDCLKGTIAGHWAIVDWKAK